MDRTGLEWIGVWVGIRIGVDRSGLEWSGSECGSRRERIGAGFELFVSGVEWIGASLVADRSWVRVAASRRERSSACVRACACESREQCELVRGESLCSAW